MNESIPIPGSWKALRRFTAARIATGRAGGSLPTAEVLHFGLDHAVARDAVHAELDLDMLEAALAPLKLPVIRVQSCAPDRLTYLQRPDLGRRLDPASRSRLEQAASLVSAKPKKNAQSPGIVIALADGLSAAATQAHAAGLLGELLPRLRRANLQPGPLVIVRQGRVAIQDEIGQALGAKSALILLGERPGLAAADSLGAYFVFAPRVGNTDAQRNCVSNIRPAGLPLVAAAETLEYLILESLRRKLSGPTLKDERQLNAPEHGRLSPPENEAAKAAED